MVVDSSALLAIFLAEPERDQFLKAITHAPSSSISVANVLETAIVLEARRGPVAGRQLDSLITEAGISIVAVDIVQLEFARSAFRLYGKGRHPAALNFGDCFAYALAKAIGEPLLAKGNDFRKTDVLLYC